MRERRLLRAHARRRAARRRRRCASGASSAPKPARSQRAELLRTARARALARIEMPRGQRCAPAARARAAPARARPSASSSSAGAMRSSTAARSRRGTSVSVERARCEVRATRCRHAAPSATNAASRQSRLASSRFASVTRARRDDARDLALDRALGWSPGSPICSTDRDRLALLHQPGEIRLERVIRHARHRDRRARRLAARRQRDVEQPRGALARRRRTARRSRPCGRTRACPDARALMRRYCCIIGVWTTVCLASPSVAGGSSEGLTRSAVITLR